MEIPLRLREAGNGIKGAEILSVLLDIILQKKESQDTKKPSRNSKD